MAASIDAKMSVSGVAEFKRNIKDAESSVKSLDSALKLNEQQFKDNGDAELYMKNKAELLKQQLEAQQRVVNNSYDALKAMKDNGVDPASKSFQDMQRKVYEAQTKLLGINSELKNVGTNADNATKEAGEMNDELQKIGTGIGWDNVAEGLEKITSKMQSAARAAINLGKRIAQSAMGSTEWADDLLTTATKYADMGIDAEMLQRMDNVSAYIDTDVETILGARQKLNRTLASENGKKTLEEVLGIQLTGQNGEDLFWEIGESLLNMSDAFDKESAASALFGKSWRELIPLFAAGREQYESLIDSQNVLTNEQVAKLGEADDAFKSFEQQVELIKNEFWAENAEKITDLLQWLIDHKDGVVVAVESIGAAFAALKVAELAANVGKVVSGFQTLGWIKGGSAGADAAASGAGSGAAAGAEWFAGLFDNLINGMGTKSVLDTAAELRNNAKIATEALENGETSEAIAKWVDAQIASGFISAADREKAIQQNAGFLDAIENIVDIGSSGGVAFAAEPELSEDVASQLSDDIESDGSVLFAAEPELPEDVASQLSEEIGTVYVHIEPDSDIVTVSQKTGGGPRKSNIHANGLWSVPFDGYPAILHKGERVTPAREVAASRNFSSNLYVESMYMNNGTDADALADRMAAAQRRVMSGYGN